jgi:hypothetical protein
MIRTSVYKSILLASGALMFSACGKVQDPAPAPATSTAVQTEDVFVVNTVKASLGEGNWALFSLQLASRERTPPTNESYGAHQQVFSVSTFDERFAENCDRNLEADYRRAMSKGQPVDVAYVGTVRLDVWNIPYRDPETDPTLCYAVHTQGGDWTFYYTPVPIVVDEAMRNEGLYRGTGHFVLDIKTANVDMLAFMPARGDSNIKKITYTAIGTPTAR